MIFIIYGPGPRRELCRPHLNDARWHINHHTERGAKIRIVPHEDAASLDDERLPKTVEEFDAVYPGQEV